jgi:hypothetical protein
MKEFLALFFYSRRGAEKESREPMGDREMVIW